jgi:hypothetical protein
MQVERGAACLLVLQQKKASNSLHGDVSLLKEMEYT